MVEGEGARSDSTVAVTGRVDKRAGKGSRRITATEGLTVSRVLQTQCPEGKRFNAAAIKVLLVLHALQYDSSGTYGCQSCQLCCGRRGTARKTMHSV